MILRLRFTHEFFYDYNNEHLKKAKHLVAICENISIEFSEADFQVTGGRVMEFNVFNRNRISTGVSNVHIDGKNILCRYNKKYIFLNEIMLEHMPELFDKISIRDGINSKEFDGFPIKKSFVFNDDINNPLNSTQDIFCQIVDILFDAICPDNYLLNYDTCKELIKEIETENSNYNSCLFEFSSF